MSGDPTTAPAETPTGFRRSPTMLLTVGLVAIVLVIVVALVIAKITSSSTVPQATSGPQAQPLTRGTATQLTGVPASVFNTVGVSSPTAPLSRLRPLSGQPALMDKGRPEVLYVGSEFCAYCAAERWALAVALSRFGKLSGLGTMQSSGNDVFSNVQTVTFATSSFQSRYITFVAKERYSDQQNADGTAFATLQALDPSESRLLTGYDVFARTGQPTGVAPFVDVANKYVSAGSAFSPAVLTGLSRPDIVSGLTDPKDVVTQAIVASANYLSAAICSVDGNRPSSVCRGPAVATAVSAMGGRSDG